MKFAEAQQSIEEYVKSQWGNASPIAFEDVASNSDLYEEYVSLVVQFGESMQTSVTKGHYRVPGLVIVTVYTRPDAGSVRKLELANAAADMLVSKLILPTPPLDAPAIYCKVPSVAKDLRQLDGWVRAQVSCPFYYDVEQ